MNWGNFLHFYQPAEQKKEILEAIINQCYEPVLTGIEKSKNARVTINISGCLLEMLDKEGHSSIIDSIRNSVKAGKIELLGSAKYHALLPLLSEDEIRRQIQSNEETLRHYFGADLKLRGFFPPEMAINNTVLKVLSEFSYKWILLDEIALNKSVSHTNFDEKYIEDAYGLVVLPRHRRISNLIMSALVRDKNSFVDSIMSDLRSTGYFVTAMDAETFGHHRPGLENLLFELIEEDSKYTQKLLSEIAAETDLKIHNVEVSPCTWASSLEDIAKGIQFLSWNDPSNEIHKLQHELLNITVSEFNKYEAKADLKSTNYKSIRNKFDLSLSSDHFWWASAKPWWSVEMIELGAFRFLDVIESINTTNDVIQKCHKIYSDILRIAFSWQRTEKVAAFQKGNTNVRIPFLDRTVGVGGEETGVYEAFISMMRDLELTASKKGDYEQAILWRDSIYRIEKKLDIFDALNAVDLVRNYISNPKVEEIIEKYKSKYRKIRSGQPEQRD